MVHRAWLRGPNGTVVDAETITIMTFCVVWKGLLALCANLLTEEEIESFDAEITATGRQIASHVQQLMSEPRVYKGGGKFQVVVERGELQFYLLGEREDITSRPIKFNTPFAALLVERMAVDQL